MEVMLDLETLSIRSNAAIAVICAVKFKRSEKGIYDDHFYCLVDIGSCEQVNLHVDSNTVKWWKEQDPQLQKEIFEGERMHLRDALKAFSKWYGNSEKIWSQGATFDIPILEEAYRKWGLNPPWKFWQARDTRTIYDLAGMKAGDLPQSDMHHAFEDCKRQIWGVQEAYRRIFKSN
jgi:hypothetical protein